jgi:hypothetical protein
MQKRDGKRREKRTVREIRDEIYQPLDSGITSPSFPKFLVYSCSRASERTRLRNIEKEKQKESKHELGWERKRAPTLPSETKGIRRGRE